ncbi:SIMPL domain-containing protein [Sphingomonas sp. PB1R3]|uniref:SIMPL domain-containing protein n=1 Tax=Sphingomonas flavida TaxID=3096154 RepID=UPI002FC77D8D
MRVLLFGALIGLATVAGAQGPSRPQIMVSGTGIVQTPPDRVSVSFTVVGEGKTSDEAAAKVRDGGKAIGSGVSGYLNGKLQWRASQFSIRPLRPAKCNPEETGLPVATRPLGSCAIQGYAATMPVTIETSEIDKAGTMVSLIGRLGGQDVSVGAFGLSDPDDARRRAMRAALVNAHDQARLIAEGSGAKLGALLRVQDADYVGEERDAAWDKNSANAPPPVLAVVPPPIAVTLTPEPVETSVRLMVAYAINQ